MKRLVLKRLAYWLIPLICISCRNEKKENATIPSIDLNRGDIVSCGPADGQLYGTVSFTASVPDNLKSDFNIAIALLHSFEYVESEKMFAKVIDQSPECAIAYWGVAMCNFHPLWIPPTEAELKKGAKAVEIARSIKNKTKRESDYIEAIGSFYDNSNNLNHKTRVLAFEKAMGNIYLNYPDDIEAAIFYSLALNAAADPTDQTYARQKKAFAILNPIFEKQPLHPGLAHYIIHNYDYPSLAEIALPAARKYAAIAPASAHAQHMPSHIFIRLGYWDEAIQSNLVSISSAKCYAEQSHLKGHWDEEIHGIDYLVYAYLQKGEDDSAKQQVDYLLSIDKVDPINFKSAYAYAASPSRYVLERKMWKEAANIEIIPVNYPWNEYPWQKAIFHFTRVLGAVHMGDLKKATTELDTLKSLHTILQKNKNKANEAAQVMVQIKASEAWIEFKQGSKEKAVQLMTAAANMEDGMEKHPVTPGEVIPIREQLGELLLEMNKPIPALAAFESNLKTHVDRFNSLYGAGIAARKSGNTAKANQYFDKLLKIADTNKTSRLLNIKSFVMN